MHILFISILPIFVYTVGHTFYQNSPLPQSQCFRSACEDPSNITFSDRTFTCFGWDSSPTLLRTLSPRWSPRDLPPQRCRRRRRRRRRRCVGGDARVPRRCSRRGTRTSACWSRQCCAAWYVNAHLISAISTKPRMHWHGVCRPKQHHFL